MNSQLEYALQWFDRYKFWLAGSAAVLFFCFVGAYWHQRSHIMHVNDASIIYHQMHQQALTKKQPIDGYVETLKADFSDTIYYVYAEFLLAKQHVFHQEFDLAKAALERILAMPGLHQYVTDLARVRLARLQQFEHPQQALETVLAVNDPAHLIAKYEISGFAYGRLHLTQQSLDSYQEALQQIQHQLQQHPDQAAWLSEKRALIQMHISDLTQSSQD